jgi:hypothetical protein
LADRAIGGGAGVKTGDPQEVKLHAPVSRQNPMRLLNLSLVKKPPRQSGEGEPKLLTDRPIQRATFPGGCAL